jgi:tetratricopeptide (TPR) repeat protein
MILFYNKGRTSWLAAVTVIYYYCSIKFGNFFKQRVKLLPIVLLLCAFFAIVYGVYLVKPDSAEGRILIYRVCSKMILDNPILGFGTGNFSRYYNLYQAAYFKEHTNSKYIMLAADNKAAFNELFQVWIEQGVLGVFFLFLVLVPIFKNSKGSRLRSHCLVPTLLSLIVCGMFSYPLRNISIFMIASIAISLDHFKAIYYVSIKQFSLKALSVLTIFTGIYLLHIVVVDLSMRIQWKKASSMIAHSERAKAISLYKKCYNNLSYDYNFLYNYGAELSETDSKNALIILKDAARLSADSDLYSYIGDCYYNLRDFKHAESYFKIASNMVPYKFYPRYKLFKVYYSTRNLEKAKEVALIIEGLDIKVLTPTALAIKNEISNFLHQ